MPQNKRFTAEEITFITENLSTMTVDDIANHLERSSKGVRNKIERLGLSLSDLPRNQPYSWSKEEEQILIENHQLPDYEIQKILPRFSLAQITRKRLDIGLRKHKHLPYIHSGYYKISRKGRLVWIHKEVAEKKIGRNLQKHEVVHHINGNKLDNNPNNLFVCSTKQQHCQVHDSLEKVAFELVKKGVIKFNHSTGKYYSD